MRDRRWTTPDVGGATSLTKILAFHARTFHFKHRFSEPAFQVAKLRVLELFVDGRERSDLKSWAFSRILRSERFEIHGLRRRKKPESLQVAPEARR
jgi:hypothetical protein